MAENLATPPAMPKEKSAAPANSKLAAIEKKYNPDQKQVAKAWKKEFQNEALQKVRLVNEQIQNAKKELAELRKQYKELKASKDTTSDSNEKYKSLERQALLIKDEAKRAEFLKRIDNRRGTVVNQSNSVAEKFRAIRAKRDYFKKLISNLRRQRKESYGKAVEHIKLQKAVYKKMIDAQYKRMFDLTAELGKTTDEKKKKEIAAQLEAARKQLKEMKGRNESVKLANTFFKKEKKTEDKNKAARDARKQQKKEKREKKIVALKNKIAVEKDAKKLEKYNAKLKELTKEEKKEIASQEKKEASNLEKLVANYKQLLQKAKESNNEVVAKALQKTIDSLTKKSDKLKDDAKKKNPGSCIRVGHVKKCKLHKQSFPNGEYYCTRTIFKSECYKCAATKTKAVKVDTKTSEVEVQRTTGKCEAITTSVPDAVVASIKRQAYDQLVLDKKVQKLLAEKLKTISPSSPEFAKVLPDLIKNDRCTRRTYNKLLKKLVQTPENAKAIQAAALSIKKEDVPEATRLFKAKLSATQLEEIKANKNNEIAIKAALSKTVDNIKKVGVQEKVEPAAPKPAAQPAANSIATPFNPATAAPEQPKVTVSLVKPEEQPKVTVSLVKPEEQPKVTVSLVKPEEQPKVTVSLVKPDEKPEEQPEVTVSLVQPKKAAKKSSKKSNVTEKRVKKNGKTIIYRTYKVKDCRKGCGYRVVKMKITLGKKKCNKKSAPKKQ